MTLSFELQQQADAREQAILFRIAAELAGPARKPAAQSETDYADFTQQEKADFHLSLVPAELKAKPNWVRWKMETIGGRLTKVPYQLSGLKASSTDPATWNTYDTVIVGAVIDENQGVGIMTDGTFIGFDLDGCRNPQTGEIAPWASRIIESLSAYTEVTPSGCGVRAYAFGSLPEGPRRFAINSTAGFGGKVGIEVYDHSRYFTVTGKRIGEHTALDSPNVLAAYELCRTVSQEFYAEKRKNLEQFQVNDGGSVKYEKKPNLRLTRKLLVLMHGKITSRAPFVIEDDGGSVTAPSQSEADMSLVTLLAMKHGDNPELIDAEFRESSLCRRKWDRLAEKTIQKAIQSAKRVAEQPQQAQAQVQTQVPGGRRVEFVRGDQVKPERLEWIWRRRILAKKLNAFSGEPDVGKGMTTIDLAARITRHTDFPDCKNELSGPKDVIFLSSEDGIADTVVPRLKVAGADMTRIHFAIIQENITGTVEEGIVCLDRDLPALEQMVKQFPDTVLIIPDPVTAFFGDADPNKDKEIRPIYQKMKSFSERVGVAWLFVNHWNKNQNATSINRTSGAKTMVAAPRATWMFSRSPEDQTRFLMMKGKGNLTKDGKTLAYRIVSVPFDFEDGRPADPDGVPKLVWDGETEHTTEQVLQDANDPTKRHNQKAETLLAKLLQDGAMLARDIYAAGEKDGLDANQMKRARYRLNYAVEQIGQRQWYWARAKEDLDRKRTDAFTPVPFPKIGTGQADVKLGGPLN